MAAVPDNAGDYDPAHQFHQRMLQAVNADILDDDLEKFVNHLGEFGNLIFFHPERLDDAMASDGFVQDVGDLGHRLLICRAQFAKFLAEVEYRYNGHGHEDQRDKRQLPVEVEDDKQQPENLKQILEDADNGTGDRHLDQGGVVYHPSDKLTSGGVMEKGDWQGVNVCKDLFPHISDDTLPNGVQSKGISVVKDSFEKKNRSQGKRENVKQLLFLAEKYFIKERLDDICLRRAKGRNQYHAGHGNDQFTFVGLKELQKPICEFFVAHDNYGVGKAWVGCM